MSSGLPAEKEVLNSNSCREQYMAPIYSQLVEIKGSGSKLEMERKRREGMNDSQQSRLITLNHHKEIKNKEGLLAFLVGQEHEFI